MKITEIPPVPAPPTYLVEASLAELKHLRAIVGAHRPGEHLELDPRMTQHVYTALVGVTG